MRRLEFRVHGIQDLLEFAGQGTRDSYMVKEFQRSAEGALQNGPRINTDVRIRRHTHTKKL